MQKWLIGVLAAGLAACTGVAESPRLNLSDLAHHRWVLDSIDGEPAYNNPVGSYGKGLVPDLDFGEQAHLGAFAGCNRLAGRAEFNDQGQFRVAQLASTRKLCDAQAMDFERRYSALLSGWSEIRQEGEWLILQQQGEQWRFRLFDWKY